MSGGYVIPNMFFLFHSLIILRTMADAEELPMRRNNYNEIIQLVSISWKYGNIEYFLLIMCIQEGEI